VVDEQKRKTRCVCVCVVAAAVVVVVAHGGVASGGFVLIGLGCQTDEGTLSGLVASPTR
jgi:hypothetical protein